MNRNTIRRILASALTAIGAACFCSLPACNTTEGVGEDIEELGDSIDDAASEND